MYDGRTQIQSALSTVLTCEYELFLDTSTATPCITYIDSGGADRIIGDTLTYATSLFTVKLWANTVADIATYGPQIDTKMKALGFKRVGSNEVSSNGLLCKILNYEAVAQEGSSAWY